eukprot:TRINITY_DN2163_c0_g1_i1.p1 TRINITY_DN2163_c0_g1~~TRINITY_DN2163_c0_g1_i1.p1  ORF type:complete len:862 (-),score=102.87 TRINITY_DN2163_c0_g1_i1:43-2607(-)
MQSPGFGTQQWQPTAQPQGQPQAFSQPPQPTQAGFGEPQQWQQNQQNGFNAPQQWPGNQQQWPQGQQQSGAPQPPPFGAPQSSGFDASQTGFGAPQQQGQTSGFGVPQPPPFGAPQQLGPQQGFGSPQQSGFGASQQTGFGSPQPPVQQSGFGTPQQQSFFHPSQQQTDFGAPQQPVQQPGFGASQPTVFGAPQQPVQQSGFGAPQPLGQFGQPGFSSPQFDTAQTFPPTQQLGSFQPGFSISAQQQQTSAHQGFPQHTQAPAQPTPFGSTGHTGGWQSPTNTLQQFPVTAGQPVNPFPTQSYRQQPQPLSHSGPTDASAFGQAQHNAFGQSYFQPPSHQHSWQNGQQQAFGQQQATTVFQQTPQQFQSTSVPPPFLSQMQQPVPEQQQWFTHQSFSQPQTQTQPQPQATANGCIVCGREKYSGSDYCSRKCRDRPVQSSQQQQQFQQHPPAFQAFSQPQSRATFAPPTHQFGVPFSPPPFSQPQLQPPVLSLDVSAFSGQLQIGGDEKPARWCVDKPQFSALVIEFDSTSAVTAKPAKVLIPAGQQLSHQFTMSAIAAAKVGPQTLTATVTTAEGKPMPQAVANLAILPPDLCQSCGRLSGKPPIPGHAFCGKTCAQKYAQKAPTKTYPCLKCKVTQTNNLLCDPCVGSIQGVFFQEIEKNDLAGRWSNVETQFMDGWPTAEQGKVKMLRLFAVFNPEFYKNYVAYSQKIYKKHGFNNEKRRFHGTAMECDLYKTGSFCGSKTCAVCNIALTGYDMNRAHSGLWGKGIYFSPFPTKSHQYNKSSEKNGVRTMFLNRVIIGNAEKMPKQFSGAGPTDPKYDAILGRFENNKWVEVIVHDGHAALPCYIICYSHS